MEIQSDLYDFRFVRRYPHCLKVFNANLNDKIYDLVRHILICQHRMVLYDKSDFAIDNNGIRISEFEHIWCTMYPNEIYPFMASEYALFFII